MTNLPKIDNFLSSDIELKPAEEIKVVELKEGEIDPRIKLLSHSSRQTLHGCPRKFQLYRLNSKESDQDEVRLTEQQVTFAYGHAVGVGIQSILEGKDLNTILLDTFLAWDTDLLAETPRQKKSIWEALFAVMQFHSMVQKGYLDDYELVYYKGKPAVELSFKIKLPDGFYYRGYVDAVLKHKDTGKVIVLECKTSSGAPNSAQYKNSGQAIGYSIVLDILYPGLSSYEVYYLVYYTAGREYIPMIFEKSPLQKALWLQELYIDMERIKLYENYGVYPIHGEYCFTYFKECEYLGLCTLSTERLTKKLTEADIKRIKEEEYMFVVDFYDLIQSQLESN